MTRQRVSSLLLEKGLERLLGLSHSVKTPAFSFGSSQGKEVAVVGSFLVHDPLGQDFTTFIVGIGVIELALLATAQVALTVRASVLSLYWARKIESAATKNAAHHGSILSQLIIPS